MLKRIAIALYVIRISFSQRVLFDRRHYSLIARRRIWTPIGVAWHYVTRGHRQGLDPNPFFDSDWYLLSNPEVRESGINPLFHFLYWGVKEKRNPSPLFDCRFYQREYQFFIGVNQNPLTHYLSVGRHKDFYPNRLFLNSSVRTLKPLEYLNCPLWEGTLHQNSQEKKITIYIPVHGQWMWTERCVQALLRTEAKDLADIVVIDDASKDDTVSNLRRYPSVKVVSAPSNLGFTRVCNYAAMQCTTEYFLLLNNDTEPLPNFLTSLLSVLENNENCAMVGSRLVFASGKLQEAGGIIWSNGTGYNFGRGEHPEKPEYLVPREVDYCSGASLLIRSTFFRSVCGFDEQYAPAYYEDVDLAFTARKHGMSVWYEPDSIVIHHEGGSHGTDTNVGLKKHQVINQERFQKKWVSELRSQKNRDDVTPWVASARHNRNGNVILFLDHDFLTPQKDAGSLRAVRLLEVCQSLGYEIAFGVEHGREHSEDAEKLRRDGMMILNGKLPIKNFLRDCPGSIFCVIAPRAENAHRWLSWCKQNIPEVPFIFDTVDLNYVRELLQSEVLRSMDLRRKAEETRRRELYTALNSDVTLVVSHEERQHLERQIPSISTFVIPTIHDVHTNTRDEHSQTRGLLFVGSFKHPPNEDGLKWFLEEVWPLVDPSIRKDGLTVIGADPPISLLEHKSEDIVFTGWVEAVEPYLQKTRLSIAPLRFGAGVKGKIGESWAFGVPVVGTDLAFSGMAPSDSSAVLSASTSNEFAAIINSSYDNVELLSKVQQSAYEVIRKNFSIETVLGQVNDLIETVEQLNRTLRGNVLG
jgi:GT2 family glycosyltransferase